MPYLDYQDMRNLAFERRLAPRSLGPRASFGEAFSAGLDAAVLGQIAPSEIIARRRAVQENLDALRKHAGDEFPTLDTDVIRELSLTPDSFEDVVQSRVRQVLEKRPELADKFHADIETRAYEMTREAEQRAQEVMARSGFAGGAGALAGSLAAFVFDPITYASLFVGGAPAAAGRSVVATIGAIAKREAAVGVTAEAAAQPFVQEYRGRAGLDSGFWLGVQNAVMAGVSSAALAGLVKGALAGGAKLYEVAGRVMHRFRTDPEFRKGLTPAERAALDAIDRDAAEMARAPYRTETVPEADAVRAAVAEATESLQAGIPLRRMDLDPLAARAHTPPDVPVRRLMGDILPEATLREMETVQRNMRRTMMTSERALRAGEVQAVARSMGIVDRQAAELTRAQQARAAVEDELDAINETLARLRRGETPDDPRALGAALDPDTAARLERISTELDQPGLSRKARRRLEDEQEAIVRSVADEALPQLERRADELAAARGERATEEQDLRDALRALRQGGDPASRQRAADTKARHQRIISEGRSPGPEDIADFPAEPTPYRAQRIAEVERHTQAAEARVNDEAAVAQRAEGRIAQELEAAPDRALTWGDGERALRSIKDELDREQSLADMIRGCRGG